MTTEQLRELCLSFPGATESIKWEDHLCFSIGDKMFCITGFADDSNVSIKADDDDFASLTERNGIIPAPYLARNKWVAINNKSSLKAKEWPVYLRKSYELIKSKLTKKLIAEIDAASAPKSARAKKK